MKHAQNVLTLSQTVLIMQLQHVIEAFSGRGGDGMDEQKNGERLRQLRGSRSAKEVANAVKISVSALLMYERGERSPRDRTKELLAKYYGTTVQSIFFCRLKFQYVIRIKCDTKA